MTTAVSDPVRDDLRIGGRYTAVDNGDGTFNILDVLVFAEVPAGAKRNKEHIGREWQHAAILRNKQREAEGHLPPVHIYHSDNQNTEPVHAGKLRLKNLKQIVYEGKKIWATTGDILGMPGDVFQLVRKGFVPYRSVEIHNWNNTEIDSLSLMPTEVPYFRVEMMTIGDIVQKFSADAEVFTNQQSPVVMACRQIKKAPAMAVLFRFKEDEMLQPDDKQDQDAPPASNDAPPVPDNQETDPEAEKNGGEDGTLEIEGNDQIDSGTETPTDLEAEGEESQGAEGEMLPGAEQPQQTDVPTMLVALKAAVDQILERIAPTSPAVDQPEPVSGFSDTSKGKEMANDKDKGKKAPAAPQAAPVTFKAGDVQAMFQDALEKAVTPLKTEIVALREKDKARDQGIEADARFRAAKDELTKARKNITPEVEEMLKMNAKLGQEQVDKAVEMFKGALPTDPAGDEDEFEHDLTGGGTPEGGADEGTVSDAPGAKFMSEHPGPEAAKFVREQRVLFKAWKKSSKESDMTFDDWLRTNHRANSMYDTNKV